MVAFWYSDQRAHGARVLSWSNELDVISPAEPPFDAMEVLEGWIDVFTEVGGGEAVGSSSQLNKDPNGKCCTTGNLDNTSALYILIIPCNLAC